jgi:glycine cleavage system transcriptional repressor
MNGKSFAIVTSMGADRPGIVAELAGWILENGGNIEDSRMSQLGGEFATLILVSGDEKIGNRLSASRNKIEHTEGLTIIVKEEAGVPPQPGVPLLRYILRATSLDHPGIVHQVASFFRQQEINIVSAVTRNTPAPFTSAPVFQFQMELDIPATISINSLRDQLRDLGTRENIDFILTAQGDRD